MTYIWDNSKASGSELLLLLAIADHSADDGYCWPTIETLAKKIRMSRWSVMRSVSSLVEKGELYVVKSNKNNRYVVVMGRESEEIEQVLKQRKETSIGNNLSRSKLQRSTDATQIRSKGATQIRSTDATLIINEPSLEPKEHGDKASPTVSQSKNKVRGELEIHFSEVTGLQRPKTNTQKQKREAGSLWWGPLREIAELCEWNTGRSTKLIDTTVEKMKSDKLTIASPKSILNLAKAIMANSAFKYNEDGKQVFTIKG